jgi:L-malate glycosyltransferase
MSNQCVAFDRLNADQKTILLITGFVCDTFSSIEMLSIHLSEATRGRFNIIWLVPTIDNRYNRFADKQNRHKLKLPLFVEELQKRGIPYIEGNISKYNLIANLILFWNIFTKCRVDAVLTQFGFERLHATFFAKLFGKTTIWHERWYSLGTKFVLVKRLFYLIFVDYFIAVSEHLGSTLPRSKNVQVVHNGMTMRKAIALSKNEKDSLKQVLGVDAFQHIVLMVAAFRDYKRHDIALKVAQRVHEKAPDSGIGFVFLGEGPLMDKCKDDLRGMDLQSSVLMPGHRLNVVDYLLVTDVVILTSYYGEGLPNCLLEGMNFKLPLIAFDVEWAREIIVPGKNGYLIPPENYDNFADSIISLTLDDQTRKVMGEEGYERFIQEFDITVWKKNITKALEQALA